jgi:hypothetical protein
MKLLEAAELAAAAATALKKCGATPCPDSDSPSSLAAAAAAALGGAGNAGDSVRGVAAL